MNFKLYEIECKCGKCDIPSDILSNAYDHMLNLEVIRRYFGDKPVVINSWYRCPDHNKKNIGGASRSKHMLGIATDIVIKSIEPSEVADGIEKLIAEGKIEEGGVGRYNTFTHYDSRKTKARW